VDSACAYLSEAGAFAASVEIFTELTGQLASVGADSWSHEQIEKHIQARGRQLLRQLFQDRLDLRQLREERAHDTGGIAPVTDVGGIVHPRVAKDHTRALASVFGMVRVGRLAYRGCWPSEPVSRRWCVEPA